MTSHEAVNVTTEVVTEKIGGGFIDSFAQGYQSFIGSFSPTIGGAVNLFVVALLITIAAWFIYKFYNSLSKRNLISLNLSQYNKYEHPVASKLLAAILYFIENILIMPILLFMWFRC